MVAGRQQGPSWSRYSVDSWNAGRTIGVFCSISKWKPTRPSVSSDPNIQFAARVVSIKLFSRPEWQFYGISILSRNGDSRVTLNNFLSLPSSVLDFCNFFSGILTAAWFRGPYASFSRWNDSRYRARRTVIQKIAQVRSKMLVTRISRRMAAVETAVPSRFIRSRNSELLPAVLELFLSLSLKHARFLGTLFVYKANVYLLNMVIFPFTLFLYLFFLFFLSFV